jgi:hypothetical protein
MQKKKIPIVTKASNGKTVFSRKRGILAVPVLEGFSNM